MATIITTMMPWTVKTHQLDIYSMSEQQHIIRIESMRDCMTNNDDTYVVIENK